MKNFPGESVFRDIGSFALVRKIKLKYEQQSFNQINLNISL